MARKPARAKAQTPPPAKSNREKIVEAFLALLADKPIEEIGFGDIAGHAGVALSECRAEFGSVIAILGAHLKETDRKVLAAVHYERMRA